MKKVITIVLSFLFISFHNVKADIGLGITGGLNMFEASGTETTKDSQQKNKGEHSEDALVPELFAEIIYDNGAALGVSYVPTGSLGSKSRKDTNTEGDTGTYKAEAEIENVFQFYTDIPMASYGGFNFYAKAGIQFATIKTLESLNSGSTYPNEDIHGYSIGLGAKGDLAVGLGEGLYYKVEGTYTDYGEYDANDEARNGNKVVDDLDAYAVKLSIGKRF